MPLEFITHNGKEYPKHEAIGGASLWIRPIAQHYCVGTGLDVGYSKEKWMLPSAIGIEPAIDHKYHAMHLPTGQFDYIHSSHCLEHVKENWCNVLDYWLSKIKTGGILFLYLPHKDQLYWNVTSNRKHIHEFDGSEIGAYLRGLGHKVFVSGCDFNHSFVVIAEKVDKDHPDTTKRFFSLNEPYKDGYLNYEITGEKGVEYGNELSELYEEFGVMEKSLPIDSIYYTRLNELFLKYKPFAKPLL